jgi:hypothetical protein
MLLKNLWDSNLDLIVDGKVRHKEVVNHSPGDSNRASNVKRLHWRMTIDRDIHWKDQVHKIEFSPRIVSSIYFCIFLSFSKEYFFPCIQMNHKCYIPISFFKNCRHIHC